MREGVSLGHTLQDIPAADALELAATFAAYNEFQKRVHEEHAWVQRFASGMG